MRSAAVTDGLVEPSSRSSEHSGLRSRLPRATASFSLTCSLVSGGRRSMKHWHHYWGDVPMRKTERDAERVDTSSYDEAVFSSMTEWESS